MKQSLNKLWNQSRLAWLFAGLLIFGLVGAASAGGYGYGKGHYGHAPAYNGGYYRHGHTGYRHGYRKGYRHGKRHGYHRGHYRKGHYGYPYGKAYRKGYRHGYRRHHYRSYRPVPRGYYYGSGVYLHSPGLSLHFDF